MYRARSVVLYRREDAVCCRVIVHTLDLLLSTEALLLDQGQGAREVRWEVLRVRQEVRKGGMYVWISWWLSAQGAEVVRKSCRHLRSVVVMVKLLREHVVTVEELPRPDPG